MPLKNAVDVRPRVRHIRTLGAVDPAILDYTVDLWRCEKVNSPIDPNDVLLLLVDQATTRAPDYISSLQEIDRHLCPLAVIPLGKETDSSTAILRLLSHDTLPIDFAKSRFRLLDCSEANLSTAPPILRRALCDSPASVNKDLEDADLLFLQGHGGPVDGGFGRSLIFCSRHLGRQTDSPLYPCFGTDLCFRQEQFNRSKTSSEGLVDPSRLRTALLVLNGCGTLVVPGSMFDYETSIARSLMESQVGAAVLTHGLNATPLSAIIVFLAALAGGKTLGEAVRNTNQHVTNSLSPSSIQGSAASPWILMGNPETIVVGLTLPEQVAEMNEGGLGVTVDDECIPAETGALISLSNIPKDGPYDLLCGDDRWVQGALDGNDRAYLWIARPETPVSGSKKSSRTDVTLLRRPPDPSLVWTRTGRLVRSNRQWFERMAQVVEERGGEPDDLRSVIALWDSVSGAIDQVAFAAPPQRRLALAPPLDAITRPLTEHLEHLNRLSVLTIAAATRFAGARLSRLWYPTWLNEGPIRSRTLCSCGCPISGLVRRHAVLGLRRIVTDCPGCGPISDVSARASASTTANEYLQNLVGVPDQRFVGRGEMLKVPIQRFDENRFTGFACEALFDPFRQRHLVNDPVSVLPASKPSVDISIPKDWPLGLSQLVLTVMAGAEMSFLDFDVIVVAEHSSGNPKSPDPERKNRVRIS